MEPARPTGRVNGLGHVRKKGALKCRFTSNEQAGLRESASVFRQLGGLVEGDLSCTSYDGIHLDA